jgi:hypothetical protein
VALAGLSGLTGVTTSSPRPPDILGSTLLFTSSSLSIANQAASKMIPHSKQRHILCRVPKNLYDAQELVGSSTYGTQAIEGRKTAAHETSIFSNRKRSEISYQVADTTQHNETAPFMASQLTKWKAMDLIFEKSSWSTSSPLDGLDQSRSDNFKAASSHAPQPANHHASSVVEMLSYETCNKRREVTNLVLRGFRRDHRKF